MTSLTHGLIDHDTMMNPKSKWPNWKRRRKFTKHNWLETTHPDFNKHKKSKDPKSKLQTKYDPHWSNGLVNQRYSQGKNGAALQLLPKPHFDQGCWTDFQPLRQYCKVDVYWVCEPTPPKKNIKKRQQKPRCTQNEPSNFLLQATQRNLNKRKTLWS